MNELLGEIKKLPIAERILLIEAIWDNIVEERASLEPSEKQHKLLMERSASFDQHPENTLTWEEIRASL